MWDRFIPEHFLSATLRGISITLHPEYGSFFSLRLLRGLPVGYEGRGECRIFMYWLAHCSPSSKCNILVIFELIFLIISHRY